MFSNKQLALFYFKPVLDDQDEAIICYYRCTLVPWIPQSSLTLFGWIRWVVMCDFALHFCENVETRRYAKLELISQERLRNGVQSVVRFIMSGAAAEMPAKFGFMLDGCSFDSEHYIAVYGYYNFNEKAQYPLLAMAPLVADPSAHHSAASPVDFLREMLMRDYSKRLDNCLFVVGGNCASNQRMATLMGASDDLDQVKKLMTKLKGLNQSAKLRFKTPLRPVLSQATRWSSTVAMMHPLLSLS
ncbi:hypothetical protein JG688_00010080 [Phytophthora aleatoria]|uniref:Uncharacterized protein n=1 Tax=Phytophthora aleatoria TaxID=2496075 RepID=A0A8J5M1Y5_9STRA|nr:hypothetical protein JG688_00010080 [Phytophthora aleatoria]